MTPLELRILHALTETHDRNPLGWNSADEVAHRLPKSIYGYRSAQSIANQLRSLDRRGLVRWEDRDGYRMWGLTERGLMVVEL